MSNTAEHIATRSAEVMWSQDLASQKLGMSLIEVRPGYAHMQMTVNEQMINGHKTCHGGYLFTLADSAFAFACNTYNQVTVAASASIDFLAPAWLGDVLTAEAQERSRAGRTGVYDVLIRNQNDQQIALFRGKSYRIKGTLFDDPASPTEPSTNGSQD